MEWCWVCLAAMRFLELILSSSMCNECEFFGFDSDEDVCLSLCFCVSQLGGGVL